MPQSAALTGNMNEYRITKYNPEKRNELGHYLDRNEWTEFSDVGKSVTLKEYELVEAAYISTAIDLVSHSELSGLSIKSLEDYQNKCSYKDGDFIPLIDLEGVVRSLLRGEFWCMLESDSAFIHIGYDYYMYIGAQSASLNEIARVKDRGLYVEEFVSPYHPEGC